MKIMTAAQEKKMIENFKQAMETGDGTKLKPVIKLFGGGACTWLLSEYEPEIRRFFGLCDLGMGFPELGYVSRDELEAIRFPPYNLPIERDLHITFDKTMCEYADEAREKGKITL